MNVDEWGQVFAFNADFDLTAKTALSLEFTKPDGTTLTVTSGVTVGSGARTNDDGTVFASGEYAKYTIADGDIDQDGEWQVRLIYDDATQHLISEIGTFTVNP